MTLNQNRVTKGVREGGQYAATAKSEADLTLGSTLVEDEVRTPHRLEDFTDPQNFLKMAYESADHWRRFYAQKEKSNHIDLDDLAQTTMEEVMRRLQRGAKVTDFKQLVNSVAANHTVRATQDKFKAEDRRAYRIWEEQVTALQNELGRNLTTKEKDAVQQKVLDEWHDPRHKPSKNFRIADTVATSLDKSYGEDGGIESTLGAKLVAPGETGFDIEPGSWMDKAHEAMDTKGAAHKAEMKRVAYNAFAEGAGAPLAQQGSLSQRQVTKHRGVMKDHKGGVLGACKDWSYGDDNEATEALFAPFGDLDIKDQEHVVSMFERFGEDRADTMWESAIALANNKHSKAAA